jgi:glyoxylase-like metal-dependent hydrolase (beta-lactamase superfamily II)
MTVPSITPQELVELLEQGEPVTVLDVRRAESRADWSIAGSVSGDGSDLDASKPVVVVCNSGNSSQPVTAALCDRGVNARSLTGGMRAWSNAWNALDVEVPGFEGTVVQVRRLGKGCLSYMVESNGVAAVFDSSLDASVYTALCSERNWKIEHVLDTHVHADHVSRAKDLAERTGSALHIPSGGRLQFDTHEPADGEQIQIGDCVVEVIDTPGHTPESVSYLVDQCMLIGGDTVFPTTVGRPDLATDSEGAEVRAHHLHASLNKVLALHADTVLLPCHADAVDVNEIVQARLGDVRDAISLPDSAEVFGASVLERVPPTPANHLRIVRINESGSMPQSSELDDLEVGANRCAVPTATS